MEQSPPKRTKYGAIVNRTLRMTPELMESIKKRASANNRTVNAEIISRLEESIEQESQPGATGAI